MKIGVIGAMEEEIALFRQSMTIIEQRNMGQFKFYIGKINNIEIILLQSGIGKANAAMGSALLIELYKPDCIMNIGTAAGFHPKLKFGDVVISSEVRYHDVDATSFTYEYGQVPNMPPLFTPAPHLVRLAEQAGEKRAKYGYKYYKGLIASGDSFLSDKKRVAYILNKLPGLYAAEMEAAAVAQACYQLKIPFIIIRAISDIAGETAKESFEKNLKSAAKHAADFTLKILEEVIT